MVPCRAFKASGNDLCVGSLLAPDPVQTSAVPMHRSLHEHRAREQFWPSFVNLHSLLQNSKLAGGCFGMQSNAMGG